MHAQVGQYYMMFHLPTYHHAKNVNLFHLETEEQYIMISHNF